MIFESYENRLNFKFHFWNITFRLKNILIKKTLAVKNKNYSFKRIISNWFSF